MRIVFDRSDLRLDVVLGGPLHPEALETWREACELSKTCINVLSPADANTTCEALAGTATHALTAGRDDRVIADFRKVRRSLQDADETLRRDTVRQAMAISLICLTIGLAAGGLWIWMAPHAPWSNLPDGLDLAANYVLLVLGWAGFTLVGFSIGWLFQVAAVVRHQDQAQTIKKAISLRQRNAYILYNSLLCTIIVITMFFFNGFEKINAILSQQLTSAPWAILLGLVAGVIDSALFDRIREFFKLS
ncbi:MAG TPA: hypothetical protein VIZ90_17035 [Rhizobiaceae bacterium]